MDVLTLQYFISYFANGESACTGGSCSHREIHATRYDILKYINIVLGLVMH